MRPAFNVGLCACVAGLLAAQDLPVITRLDRSSITPAQMDQTVIRLMKAAEVTGVGITIFNNGRIAYTKTYGFRDAQKQLPLTENSVVSGASLTKAAFAYMVMQLVAERVLDLDKPVRTYLSKRVSEYPAFRDLAGDARAEKITPRMLLSHTTGFPNLRFLNSNGKLNINFDPGSRYAYSGEGIQLLQLVVEAVTQRSVKDLMRERVFDPLGMKRTSMVSETRFEDDYASGHDEYGRSLGHPRRPVAAAAGSMQTTLRDFTSLMHAIIQGKGLPVPFREAMLSPQIEIRSKRQFPTLEASTTDENKAIRLSYGLGWGLFWTPFGKAFFKEGHEDGFQHYTVVFDKPKSGIIILTNSANGEGTFKELLESLLGNTFTPVNWHGYTPYSDRPQRKPLPIHKEISVAPALLDRLVRRYAFTPNVILKVTRKDGHLLMQENEEAPGELFPEAELRFFSKTSDDVVTFELDKDGRVDRLVIHTGGKAIPVKRVE